MNKFEQARKIFHQACDNTHSSFYRDVYAERILSHSDFPRSREEWNLIPIISKKAIQSVPFEKRIFVPDRDVHYIRYTSGTSGTGILCLPLQKPPVSTHIGESRNILSFRHRPNRFHPGPHNEYRDFRLVHGDQSNFPASVALARAIDVDTLDGAASKLIALAPFLRERMDLSQIRWLWLHAERCTGLQLKALRELYPKAHMLHSFAFIEAQGPIAFSPKKEIPDHPFALVSEPHALIEIVGESEQTLMNAGAQGDIVVTILSKGQAFPLVRYRNGDRARVLVYSDDKITFEILGRSEGERVRITGGEIYVAELERVITPLYSEGIVDFEARVGEKKVGEALQITLSIALLYQKRPKLSEEECARRIAATLRVNQKRSYQDGVERGLYQPLVCSLEKAELHANTKRVRLRDMRE